MSDEKNEAKKPLTLKEFENLTFRQAALGKRKPKVSIDQEEAKRLGAQARVLAKRILALATPPLKPQEPLDVACAAIVFAHELIDALTD